MSEADAAAVASKLLDFYREPARYRPRYLNGQETISGQWVFKFAQARFPHAVLRAFDLDERRRLHEPAPAASQPRARDPAGDGGDGDGAPHADVLGERPAGRIPPSRAFVSRGALGALDAKRVSLERAAPLPHRERVDATGERCGGR